MPAHSKAIKNNINVLLISGEASDTKEVKDYLGKSPERTEHG